MGELRKFVANYIKSGFLRLHIPGHQGRCGFLNRKFGAKFDITEIAGADWLYGSCGVLRKLEQSLANFFDADLAISTCGSTLCVQTMVALCKNKTFIAHRDSAHVSFFNACALFNVCVKWIGGVKSGAALADFEIKSIEQALARFPKGSCAVYLTSPDYYGGLAPVLKILKVCRKFDALLLVDCAHGAHLNFVNSHSHPINLGVDLCCSSLHKTLPTLTGAAALHFNSCVFSRVDVKSKMAMLATTSPSYLTMTSIDFCVDWLAKKGVESFQKLVEKRARLIKQVNLPFLQTDVTKLTIDCRKINLSGLDVSKMLRKSKIEPEFADTNFVILVLSPFLNFFDWRRLYVALKKVEAQAVAVDFTQTNVLKQSEIWQFKVDFGVTEMVELNDSIGRICAETKFKSPPGTVLVSTGELIDFEIVQQLKLRGCSVIKVFAKN